MRVRLIVGMIVLVVASVFSNARLYRPTEVWSLITSLDATGSNEIYKYFDRVRELKGALPEQGYVGFVTDHSDSLVFSLAQHAVVPLFMGDDGKREYIIGIFRYTRNRDAQIEKGMKVILEAGDGVILLKTSTAQ